jgi:hypothetical protein
MAIFCKRRRKVLAPVVLAFWLFAVFVSVVHACGLDENLSRADHSEAAMVGSHEGSDDWALPTCDKFCSDDHPVLAKLKAVEDPPTGQALMVPSSAGEAFQTAVGSVPSLRPNPDPSPGIALSIRFARLAL